MPTKKKTTTAKIAAPRPLKIARYVTVTGELAAALKQYQGLLKGMAAGRKIDVSAFDAAVKAMNTAGDNFDKLTEKHEQAVLEYVDLMTLE